MKSAGADVRPEVAPAAGGSRTASPPAELRAVRWAATTGAILLPLLLLLAQLDRIPQRMYAVGGHPTPRTIWLHVAGPPIGVAALAALALAVGLARERRWARHCTPVLFASVAVLSAAAWRAGRIPSDVLAKALIECGVLGLASAWYFYRKKSVAEYFGALRGSERKAAPPAR
ncbi:MAG: hypothetical protein U0167_10190 [bacterium]